MRLAVLSRSSLGEQHIRLDPTFHFGRELVRDTLGAEGSQHARLLDIVESVSDGARLPNAASGIPMLRLKNVRPCELDMSGLTRVDGSAGKWVCVRENDVVFTRAAQPFRAAAVRSGAPADLCVSSELIVIRPRPAVLPEYLAAVLCTPTLNQILRDFAYRGQSSALPRLRLSDIERLPVPLPPRSLQESLAERYRQAVDLTASALAEINAVASAIYAEIDHSVLGVEIPGCVNEVLRSSLLDRWDAPFNRGRKFRNTLETSPKMRRLLELAKARTSSLRALAESEMTFVVQAENVNEATFLVESGEQRSLADLSARMRQRLEVGDVLICTTGSGEQVAYVDEGLGHGGHPILGSATFTPLQFKETPRFFAVSLAHPLVREQLRLLSSGSVQRFVNKRDLDELFVPVLGQVWREDFETRLTRAMQRRREGLLARSSVIEAADKYLRETMPCTP